MSPRPAIFISAVSCELRSARQLVANTLTFLGYESDWQEIFGTEAGDLRAMLRRRIDACKGLVQLVGECYGAEPPAADDRFGRVSYTQYEALYASSRGKRVWYLFLDESFPVDSHDPEDPEKKELQRTYRDRLKADAHLYHSLGTREGLENSVLKLRDDLTRLRRGVKRWAMSVAILLLVSVGLSVWLLKSQHQANQQQQQANQRLDALQARLDKLQEGVNSFAEVQNKVSRELPNQKPEQVENRTYEELGKQLGLDPVALKEQLPRFADELRKSPTATTYERANAAYVAKEYNEAERLALAAADEAQRASPPKNADAIRAFELAGWSAEKRIDYADALTRFQDAEKLTDRTRDPLEWARVQFGIGMVHYDRGQYSEAESLFREVLQERERMLGAEHADSLETRSQLENALYYEGKYAEDEEQIRVLLALKAKALGLEHPETLKARNNLGALLFAEGKYAEAETEFRAVLKLKEKVLGPEHQDTFGTRNNLASTLAAEGKYAESEAQFRTLVKLDEKAFGPEHPNTLATRGNLAELLDKEGKYAEAETEERQVLKLDEKVLGPEHPDTLDTRANLAGALLHQGRYVEAETEARQVVRLDEKVCGAEHPSTLEVRNSLADAIAAQGKYPEAETEYRSVLTLREKVLGVEHPDTLETCFNLAICLRDEGKASEAKALAQRAADGARKSLGREHPDTKKYEQLRDELFAKQD
jgi:tetratricopeptide (TPR) repeat protein